MTGNRSAGSSIETLHMEGRFGSIVRRFLLSVKNSGSESTLYTAAFPPPLLAESRWQNGFFFQGEIVEIVAMAACKVKTFCFALLHVARKCEVRCSSLLHQ
jgi:hypothetical protein